MLELVRWVGDFLRGYARAAEMREGAAELLRVYAGDGELAGSVLVSVRLLDEARHAPGALGVGARVAITAEQLEALRLQAQDARAESQSVELAGGGEA